MLFRRTKRRSPLTWVRHNVWPQRGWRRAVKYLGHRLVRLPGETGGIARGLACGVAISFSPFITLHMIIAVLISWAIRGNKLAAAIGTIVGNPVTFLLMWPASYHIGAWVLQYKSAGIAPPFQFECAQEGFLSTFTCFWPQMVYFVDHFWELFWPMLIGSVPLMTLAWLVTFFVARKIIHSYRTYRYSQRRILRRQRGVNVDAGL